MVYKNKGPANFILEHTMSPQTRKKEHNIGNTNPAHEVCTKPGNLVHENIKVWKKGEQVERKLLGRKRVI